MQTNGFNLSTVQPTSTTTLRYIGCSQDSESFSSPAREPRALNRPVAHPLQTTKDDGLSYGRLRQLPSLPLALPRLPQRKLQLLFPLIHPVEHHRRLIADRELPPRPLPHHLASVLVIR